MSQQARFRKVAFDNSDILDILKNIPIETPSETPSENPSETPLKSPADTSKTPSKKNPDLKSDESSNESSNDNKNNKTNEQKARDLWENFKSNFFDEEELRELLPYFFAGLKPFQNEFRYSPAAFEQALETNKNIGYNGTSHSQGAYQKTDPKVLEQVKKFKKSPPKNLKDLRTKQPTKLDNINVPSTSDRYKSMRSKLYGKSAENTEAKFIKTSANNTDISKLLPNWNINDVLTSMKSVADKTNLSPAEKQQNMINILAEYEKSIAPLSQFLDKNDIKYK